MIQGAGVVLWRREDDEIHVCLVHRSRYDDWSLPKGKREASESLIACAYRETLEETGYSSSFGRYLGEIEYAYSSDTKIIKYWSAEARSQVRNISTSEISDIEWLPISAAISRVNYESDKEILRLFNTIDLDTTTLILLRHCKAISRDDWRRSDIDRPLSDNGITQSVRLAQDLLPFEISEVYTSPAERCMTSVLPIAQKKNVSIRVNWSIEEERFIKNKADALETITKIMKTGDSALLCSHNPVLPHIVKKLIDKFVINLDTVSLDPADAWIIHHLLGEVIAIDSLKYDH